MPTVEGELGDEQLRHILGLARRIAVVGLSPRPERPSHGVARYLQEQGYAIDPVNPTRAGDAILGRTVYASLRDLPEAPDIIDVFRRPEYVDQVVDDAIAARAARHPDAEENRSGPLWVLWTQLGVVNPAAAARAHAAGFGVVQDRCLKVEHARLDIGPAPAGPERSPETPEAAGRPVV
jgi:predicted CoA-binding protein